MQVLQFHPPATTVCEHAFLTVMDLSGPPCITRIFRQPNVRVVSFLPLTRKMTSRINVQMTLDPSLHGVLENVLP